MTTTDSPAAQPQEGEPNVTMPISELLERHPRPWTHHCLLIKDANGKQVIHTGGSYNDRGRINDGRYLSGLNALLVELVNTRADLPRATAVDDAWLTEIESACNALLLDVYDLSIANAPISPEYARQTVDCIGHRVGQVRESVAAIRAPCATADDQALKKLAARVIDAVLQSPVVVETRCFSQPQEVDRLETQVVALLAAAPRATGEIEACLAELREMFPGKVILVRREDSFYPPDCRDAAETNSMVTIKIGYLESEPKFRSFRSLADCMTQVRAARKGKERIREQNS
jgi:hypothetical protein